jgi:amino acid adenylation domain-containing protein
MTTSTIHDRSSDLAMSLVPASFAQQRLWFLDQLEPQSTAYNIPASLRLNMALDLEALEQSFDTLIQRHEVLRTTLVAADGQPMQVVAPTLKLQLPLVDLSALAPDEREAEALRLANEQAQRPFDLSQGPLMRVLLLKLDTEEYLLLLTMHQIISDGWSLGVLFQELASIYTAFSRGRPSPLPDVPIQYADYALWQQERIQEDVLAYDLAYWKQQLGGAPALLDLPTDRPRPVEPTSRGAVHLITLPPDLTGALKTLSRREGVTLYMTLVAAFQTLLYRYTGQDDMVVGTFTAGRTLTELEALIGFFVNTLVLRTDLSGNPTFRELLGRVRKVTFQAHAHQEVPFESLVRELQPTRALGQNPLSQVMLILQPPAPTLPSGWELSRMGIETGAAKFDLSLDLADRPEGLVCRFEYRSELFDTATIARLAGHWQTLLKGIVAHPEQRLVELPLLTEAERYQLLVEWNQTSSDLPKEQCIHQLFEAQVERTPDAVAVVVEDEQLTYQQLNRKANQLARYLQQLGVGPEVPVGLYVERSLDMVVGLLGILKAGGAYVPLDPTYPAERLAFILKDAQVPVLLTQQALMTELTQHATQVISLDSDRQLIAQQSEANPVSEVTCENLVYVIYTSGSTGKPKGVLVEHRNLLNYTLAIVHRLDLPAGASFAAVSTLATDLGNTAIFPTLCSGGCLHVISRERAIDAHGLAEYFQQHPIDCLKIAPSHLSVLQGAAGCVPVMPRRRLVIGGEASAWEWVTGLQALAPACTIFNHYGPTETTVGVLAYRLQQEQDKHGYRTTPLGRPLANTRIYLLDQYQQPVPVGVAGEVYIGGAGVARGYLNQPELTTERFIADPFSGEPGARLYKTGDRARYLPDGNIEFLGRFDDQVKLRGFRIEPGEIEVVLNQHPAVQSSVVMTREDVPGDKRLVAYIVLHKGQTATVDDLRHHVMNHLPPYMVPSACMLLEALPLTPNGKVDRQALPTFDQLRPQLEGTFVAPRTPVEEALASIWAELLGLERVGSFDNFFELGGHSLLATQVVARIRDTFHIELAVRSLFENPTVAGLASQLEKDVPYESGTGTIPRRGELTPCPPSFAQQRLWFLEQLTPGTAAYNEPLAIQLEGALNVPALEKSLNEIVRRHEALRTTFAIQDGQPVQIIAPMLSVQLPIVDLRNFAGAQRQAEAQWLTTEEAEQPFDLTRGPLLRATLLWMSEQEYLLLLVMHHIVFDGWSSGVFIREQAALYEAFATGKPLRLPPLPIQYADFAAWQRQWLQDETLETQLAYWRKQLAGAPDLLELPADHPRPAVQTFRGARLSFVLSEELTDALKALSRREGITLFMILLAAFNVLLYRYTGQTDIVVGSPIANRNRSELEGLIGFFVNTLVFRTNLAENPSFEELLRRIRKVALEAYAHQDLPFERLVEELHPERKLSHNPLFQVMFSLENDPTPTIDLPGLRLQRIQVGNETAKFDLGLSVGETGQGLTGSLEYSTDLFEPATMSRMVGHFQRLLEGIVVDLEQPISDLPLLTEAERHQLIVEWNETSGNYPSDQCIHQIIEEQAERTPDAVAVVFEDERLTYRELNGRANQLARYLQLLGVGPEVRVGIYVERSLDMIVGLLGILKAGGAYVPLDPAYPEERLAFLLADTQMPVLLTQQRLVDRLPEQHPQLVCLDTDWQTISRQSEMNPKSEVKGEHLAYVIYTSGSTGQPKGALIEHRALVAHCWNMVQAYELRAEDRVLQFFTYTFDGSLEQILPTLMVGARLVLRGKEAWLPADLLHKVKSLGLTVISLTAAYWHHVMQEWVQTPGELAGHQLRLLIIGGERLLPETLELWWQTPLRLVRLVNVYGPTEATIIATIFDITRHVAPDQSLENVPIGRPLPNRTIYILDRVGNPVPVGMSGELYIGGYLLARGYLNRPELTAERFIADPFSREPGARLYKTGDLARYLPDGTIEFLGRIDEQVKVRGYRIELGEIEAVLGQHPAVRQTVVVAREDKPGDKRLVAYVVLYEKQTATIRDLQDHMMKQVPTYMVPSAFVLLEALPLMPNGKVDRRALPAPADPCPELEERFVAPRNALEKVMAEMWSQALGIERVGIHDDFFALGGHSLLAMQVISRLRAALQAEVPLRAFFEAPTIAQLAEIIPRLQAQRATPPMPAPGTFSREAYRVRMQSVSSEHKKS